MAVYLPYELTKSIEALIPDPELAKKVINTIEQSLASIEEKAKEQKVIIKTELKDELTKELITKAEFRGELKATEERLRGELKATEERLRTEIHKWRADTIKWMFVFWLGQLAAFAGILVGILKIMLK